MSEQLQTEINDLIIERLAQLQAEVDEMKRALRAATIHPEMFTWSEAPHGR